MKYPSKPKQIKEFGIWVIYCRKLKKVDDMETAKRFYGSQITHLHHYIKEQSYYKYPERYKGMQKLILMPSDLHMDLHSSMSDERFLKAKSNEQYKIERDVLLYRHRKVD